MKTITKPSKLKIQSVRLEIVPDADPDTSWLGTFTDEYSPNHIHRRSGKFASDIADGEQVSVAVGRREYEYFTPGNHWPHNPANWEHVQGDARAKVIAEYGCVGLADKAYALADWKRMEDLENDQWGFVGVIAKAEVWNPDTHVTQTIRSGGLWGIESDSEDYIESEVGPEQLAELRTELEALGIGSRAITHAFKSVQTANK